MTSTKNNRNDICFAKTLHNHCLVKSSICKVSSCVESSTFFKQIAFKPQFTEDVTNLLIKIYIIIIIIIIFMSLVSAQSSAKSSASAQLSAALPGCLIISFITRSAQLLDLSSLSA